MIASSPEERAQRDDVVANVLEHIRRDQRIALPAFSGTGDASEFALQSVGTEPNPFGGRVGPYRYQFEGEDDLLHLFIVRGDGGELAVEDGQTVVQFVLPNLPPSLIWLKPGRHSQHFYFGHDLLL